MIDDCKKDLISQNLDSNSGNKITILNCNKNSQNEDMNLKKKELIQIHNSAVKLFTGNDSEKDIPKAVNLFTQAANEGFVPSQFNLAKYYFHSTSEEDKSQGFHFAMLAAESNMPEAQVLLGQYYIEKNDFESAVSSFTMAAKQHNLSGLFNLAQCALFGKGISKDINRALELFKQAAKLGDMKSQIFYSTILAQSKKSINNLDSQEISDIQAEFKLAGDFGHILSNVNYAITISNQEPEKAFGQFGNAAYDGSDVGQFFYGYCLFNGIGTHEDKQTGIECFKKAAIKGNPQAQFNYGLYLQNSSLEVEAMSQYKLAADQNFAPAQNNYATLISISDPVIAALYFQAAADNGFVTAMFNLGLCFLYGFGVTKNISKAMKNLKNAADLGDKDAQFRYALLLESHMKTEDEEKIMINYLQKAADQDQADALVKLGLYLHTGFIIQPDSNKASACFKKAADLGSTLGQFNYGLSLLKGEGVTKDVNQAMNYFRLAANSNYLPAIKILIENSNNRKERSKYIKLAIDLGDLELLRKNASELLHKKKYKEAADMYERAAIENDPFGLFNLGVCYLQGKGRAQDLEKAETNFQLAAQQNYPNALHNYNLLVGMQPPNYM